MSTNVIQMHSHSEDRDPSQVVADNLAAELARRRMSGRQASAAMGLSVAYVARRISGDTEMSVSDLFAFARLLGVSVDVLLAGAAPGPESPANLQPTDYEVGGSGAPVVDLFTRRDLSA